MESLTGPLFHHRRKLSSASSTNSNGLSFSGKDAYDDVLLVGSKPRVGAVAGFASRKVAAEDYAEIFGGRNGTRGSSIPVLDLSDLDERHGSGGFRSSNSKLDYSTIFGGFGGGAGADDVATPVRPYEELFNGVKKVKRDKAKARISTDPCPPLKGSDRFNSSEKNKSHSSEASEDFVDGGKQFNMSYHKTGQRRKDGSSGTTHIAQLHAVPGFTCIIDETARLQKVEQNKALSQVKAEFNHKQGSFDHLQKTELDKAMPPLKTQVSHNQSSSDCLQKTERDKAIPSVKSDVNHKRSCSDLQPKGEKDKAMPQVKLEVNHNRSSNVDISEEKSGRRAKWQLPTVLASESLVKDKGECYQDASNSSDKLSNMEKSCMKSHPYNVPPPCSSSANLFDSKGHTNRSNSSSYDPKVEASEKVTGGYPTPFSDEELDVNSVAAASAAALKKAVEQAQESIRIVKEIMERKRDSGQSSKLHSKGRLKTKDAREMKHVQEVHNVREENVNEACRSVDNEMLDFCGADQYLAFGNGEVALPFKDCEEPSTGRQGEVAINGENVEVSEENGVATWFSQLLSTGKHRVAALASELVGKRNSTVQTLDKEKHSIEEPNLVKVTMDLDTSEKVNAVHGILESGDTEGKLNALGRSEELKKNVDGSESSFFVDDDKIIETHIFSQADEVTKNARANLVEKQNCKEKHEDFNEKISEGHFEPEMLGNLLRENDFLKLEKRSSDQEGEEKLEDIHVCEQEDCKVDEEVDLEQEDFHLRVGNEHALKRAACCVCRRKGLEDDSEDRLEGYYKQETDGQRSTQSVNGEENQNMSEEEHVWDAIDRRSAGSCQSIEEDSMDEDADNSSVHQKIEVDEEVQEVGNSWDRTADSVESPGANLFQEAAYKESLDTDLDAYNNDQSVNLDDIQEACRSEVENCSEQNSQQERRNNEEEAHRVGIPESFYEFQEDVEAAEGVEEASTLNGEEVHTMESGIRDVSEVVDFVEKTADFGFTKVNCEADRSKDAKTAITTVFISNCTTEDTIDGEQANDAPSEVKDSSNFDFIDMNGQKQIHHNDSESEYSIKTESCARLVDEVYGQKQSEEIDRGFESGVNPANGNDLVHESGGNAESVHVDGIAHEKDDEKDTIELHLEERECIKNQKEPGNYEFPAELKREEHEETNTEMKTGQSKEHNEENGCKTFAKEDKETRENVQKEEAAKDCLKSSEKNEKEREQQKHRIAVERAIREARERAFAEARERAERAAVDKATADVRQRAMAEAREKLEKKSAGPKVPTGKASSIGAKLRAERAAVERATAEARERALEKALSQKTTSEMRTQAERNASGKFFGASRDNGLKHSFSSSDLERFDETNNESAQRRKARLERHQRIMERAAKALAEKNLRDVLAQREQAERNRLAETLDADIKRWASGKEGNLRALLSTLQYILGPNSGWQPISLTEIITSNAVKKAYRKATLYVHPDKLQQRGASIQQKYICEKVFDLLKAAWNKFNSEER